MSMNVIQTSFAAGELSPSIFARTDLTKYHTGAAIMRNFFVDYRSGASTRMGTKYVIHALKPNTAVRLIPYQLSSLSTFIIEFGDFYCRFITNGGAVLESAFNIIGATNSSPTQINVPGHNFVAGDWIFISGVGGMTPINNQYFIVSGVSGDIISLSYPSGNFVSSVFYPVYTFGGIAQRVYTIPSPYAAADLALLKYSQVSNAMTLTHPNYPPYTLSATTVTNWAFTLISFATTLLPPTGVNANPSSAGSTNYAYVVTSLDASGQESAPSNRANLASAVNVGVTAGTITVSWVAAANATSYNVYKAEISFSGPIPSGAAFGFVGTTNGVSFVDSNIVPDFLVTPPIPSNPFAGGNNPGCTCFFQQRQYYASSLSQPATFWASQPGIYNNFNVTDPVLEDNAITGTLISRQVNAIKNMLPMPGGLIMMTSEGAWQISGGGGVAATTAVTPINIVANPQAYNGSNDMPPIVINYDILFVQSKGTIVRDLAYNIYANIYTGSDISVLSNHLFYGHTMVEWAWSEEPFKIVWVVRDDGILLSLTYVKEQEMFGWSRHDTLGLFKSVASIREGIVDAIYVVVKRFINGVWTQIIERIADRSFPYGAEDAFCVDCGTQSAVIHPAADLVASSSSGAVTFTANANVFTSGDVGSILRMDGGIATITSFISPTSLGGTWTQVANITIPNDTAGTPLPAPQGTWSLTPQFNEFGGLQYLEGQTVSILADGGVVTPQVVTNGKIDLAQPASKVIVGLPFTAQLQTMYLDMATGDGGTIQGKRKKINALSVRAVDTRGLLAGRLFSTVVPIKQLTSNTPLGQPIPLQTGDQRVIMDPLWDVPGQICLQVSDPLPCTVLGVIPEITVGDTVR